MQLFMLIFVCILGFPTTILANAREKLAHDTKHDTEKAVDKLDQWIFWLFISGIFKDPRKEVMFDFYQVIISISICLFFERIFITWLFTRNGCTYNRFQKFIEMDLRR